MRRFKLINAHGEIWDLNQKGSFMVDPSGLGQEHKTEYEQIGNFFVKNKDLLKQKTIAGKINFSGYDKFNEFSKFIQHKPLVLEYEAVSEVFAIDISVDKLEKTELSTGWLVCPIKFTSISTFYKIVRAENSGDGTIGKIFPYAYAYTYADRATGTVEINADSTLDSPVKLTILGPCTNPSWTHYLNGIIAGTGKVNCTIPGGHRLVVDDSKIPFEIAEYDSTGSFVKDLYQKSDFSTNRFIMLGFGSNRISFNHEGDTALKFIAEGRVSYESV